MIHYLEHNAIDRRKWDALIAECGNVYAFSWYLDIVHPQWEALVEDDYQAVMPVTGGKKFGVRYLFQPFFVQQLGVFSTKALLPERTSEFLNAIPKEYRFAEIRLNESNALNENIQHIGFHRNVILDLNQDFNSIRAKYHTNAKRNLAKAEGNGLCLTDEISLSQIIELFRSDRGASVGVWGDTEYNTLLRLGEAAQKRNAAFLVGVRKDADLLCGALFMQACGRITFLFSGNSEAGKRQQAMTFLLDRVIQKHANQPLTFDFEGSDDANLARFYLGFGGVETKYPSFAFNRLSPFGKSLLKAWKRLK